MKETLFILLVVLVLALLTAFRYRRQISAAQQVWRMLKSARVGAGRSEPELKQANQARQLVKCARCGTWVPEPRAIRFSPTLYYCSEKCSMAKTAA
jgi:hypothetical protein